MLAAQTTKGPRSLAIAEGLLLDVTPAAREVEIEHPVALTRALWHRCVTLPLLTVNRRGTIRTRLLDVLISYRIGAAEHPGAEEVELLLVGFVEHQDPLLVPVKAIRAPGDDGEPAITLMLLED